MRWAEADPSNALPFLAVAGEARAEDPPDWPTVEEYARRGSTFEGAPNVEDRHVRALLLFLWAEARLSYWQDLTRAERLARQAIEQLPGVMTREKAIGIGRAGLEVDMDQYGTVTGAWLLLGVIAFRRREYEKALRCATQSGNYATSEDWLRPAVELGSLAIRELARIGLDSRDVKRLADDLIGSRRQ
jgi:hypothetical protein